MTGVVAALRIEALALGLPVDHHGSGRWIAGRRRVAVSGIGCAAAEAAAWSLIGSGATALLSWGLAGAIDPALRAGTVCIPERVISRGGASRRTDPTWRARLGAALVARCTIVNGNLLTVDAVIADTVGKAALFRETGAVAVDMESLAVAAVAAAAAVPFMAVRVIVDTANDRLPDSMVKAAGPQGIRLLPLLIEILRAPGDLAPLLRIARQYRLARRSLVVVAGCAALDDAWMTA
ncbi:MAG: purine phosphorylase [Steroidobacteraceae bacterium]